jgi:hypothetical protein
MKKVYYILIASMLILGACSEEKYEYTELEYRMENGDASQVEIFDYIEKYTGEKSFLNTPSSVVKRNFELAKQAEVALKTK